MNSLDRMIVNFVVNHLPKRSYFKALRKCQADQIKIRRDIDYLYSKLEQQLYLQELLEKRMK